MSAGAVADTTALHELATSVFGDAWSPDPGLDAALWATADETGLARLTLPEAEGGSGASFAEAAVVLSAVGRFAARVPLVETDWLAGPLLAAAGLEMPDGPLSAGRVGGGTHLDVRDGLATGTLRRIPHGRSVAAVAVLDGRRVVLVRPTRARIVEGTNVAEEPRDDVVLDGTPVTVGTVSDEVAAEYPLRAALGRALLIAGAAHGALAMAVRYAGERVQFGRSIGRLQA
ncbi:acyl-CoA dehydrogenase family protein, partial [Pseudonocardia ailaonensis]